MVVKPICRQTPQMRWRSVLGGRGLSSMNGPTIFAGFPHISQTRSPVDAPELPFMLFLDRRFRTEIYRLTCLAVVGRFVQTWQSRAYSCAASIVAHKTEGAAMNVRMPSKAFASIPSVLAMVERLL